MILERNFEQFELLLGTRTADGKSGFHTVWSVSGTVDAVAAIGQTVHDRARSTETVIANAELPKPLYSILTKRSVLIPFHAVLRRVRDGKIFRITNNADDAKTPNGAKLDLRMHSAEEYRLPDASSWAQTETEGENSDQS